MKNHFKSLIYKVASGIFLPVLLFQLSSLSVLAQDGGSVDLGESIVPEEASSKFGLESISIPFFKQAFSFDTEYASLFSWIGFALSIYTVAVVVFWVFYILKATVNAIRSSGEAEKLEGAYTQVKSVLIAAGISILFPIALSFIGLIIGAGSVFNWPKAFRSCPGDNGSSPDYQYYFQAALNLEAEDPDVYCGY